MSCFEFYHSLHGLLTLAVKPTPTTPALPPSRRQLSAPPPITAGERMGQSKRATPRFTTFCNRHRPLKRIFPFPKGNYTATAACARRCLAKPLQRLLAAAAVLVEQQHHHWGDMIRCAGSERPAIETESICCETCSDQPICAQCSSSSVAQQAPGGPRV